MKEIVERLMETHHIYEMTKHDALSNLRLVLADEYPDCDISFNNYHNCIEVSKDGIVQWQVYPARTKVESRSYRYVRVEDINQIPPGTPLYIREPRNSHHYNYSDKSPMKKHVDKIVIG